MRDQKGEMERFVGTLSESAVRRELVNAYMQMERCQMALRGLPVEPVVMADNGQSSDLELFWQCRKMYDELSYVNKRLMLCRMKETN